MLLTASRFFLYQSADHRDLHSFPTRRSSDLTPHHQKLRTGRRLVLLLPRRGVHRGRRAHPAELTSAQPTRSRPRRSEEHTSELQSPDHLVCRLLLEKKKQQTTAD